jgi:hypothetical protein
MATDPRIDQYIKNQQDWQQAILLRIRAAIHSGDPDIAEDIKWGAPYYEHEGGVAWTFCANEWVHLSFRQGALLDDSHGLFEPTTNKAMRTIKFKKHSEVPAEVLASLASQAVANNQAGTKIKFTPEPKKELVISGDIQTELNAHKLADVYQKRPYYQRKGYLEWVNSAKRDDTRNKRIQIMIEELENGTFMPPKSAK